MAVYKTPQRITELKNLHKEAAESLTALEVCKINNRLSASCTQFEDDYQAAMEKIVDIHEEAAEQHKEWIDGEFGDDLKEDKMQRQERREMDQR